MSFYPQIGSGSVTQFPFARARLWRAITNRLESDELITLPDAAAGTIAWTLKYEELTDDEAQRLSALFSVAQGGFEAFTFVDPMTNLLGWSEDFTRSDWQTAELNISAGVSDPLGTQRASTVANVSPGALQLSQTLGISGDSLACFAAYVRTSGSATITMQRDELQVARPVSNNWKRVLVSGSGIPGATQSTFSIGIPAGQTVDVWGLQVEAQPFPSVYKPTKTASGIYEQTYFADDELTIAGIAPGLSRTSINLVSRV